MILAVVLSIQIYLLALAKEDRFQPLWVWDGEFRNGNWLLRQVVLYAILQLNEEEQNTPNTTKMNGYL